MLLRRRRRKRRRRSKCPAPPLLKINTF